jgi:hypothetical protein
MERTQFIIWNADPVGANEEYVGLIAVPIVFAGRLQRRSPQHAAGVIRATESVCSLSPADLGRQAQVWIERSLRTEFASSSPSSEVVIGIYALVKEAITVIEIQGPRQTDLS